MKFFNRTKKEELKVVVETKKVLMKKPVVKKEKEEPKKKGPALFVKEKHVLVRPLITEKVTYLEKNNQYVFAVHPNVNKIEIKDEIKKIYKVEPMKVNIIKIKGKEVRRGNIVGKQNDWKKAVVFLKKGDKIVVNKAL